MIYTFALNFNAVTFVGTPRTTHAVGKGGAIRITKPRAADSNGLLKFDAWSAWPADDSVFPSPPPVPVKRGTTASRYGRGTPSTGPC